MSKNNSFVRKLVASICAMGSFGAVSNAVEPEPEDRSSWTSMSSPFDFTFKKATWEEKVEDDIEDRIETAVSLPEDVVVDGLGSLRDSFVGFFKKVAHRYYEVFDRFMWSSARFDEEGMDNFVGKVGDLWGTCLAIVDRNNDLKLTVSNSSDVSARTISILKLKSAFLGRAEAVIPRFEEALSFFYDMGCGAEIMDIIRSSVVFTAIDELDKQFSSVSFGRTKYRPISEILAVRIKELEEKNENLPVAVEPGPSEETGNEDEVNNEDPGEVAENEAEEIEEEE